ncbi:MAG: hypothetical protein M3Q73_04485 [bacterium]|nr:hypothetical protein [bacterium]
MKTQTRKNLNIQAMLGSLQPYFSKLEDPRQTKTIPLTDIIMSGLAVYQLKIPALQLLDDYRNEPLAHPNLKRLFGIQSVPSDTQLRDVLDRVPTDAFRIPFDIIFRTLQQDKALEQFKFYDGNKDQYLIATDATGIFGSTNIKCDHCLAKMQRDQGEDGEELLYHHQLLAAAIVHPDRSTVIPLAPEPIIQQDGNAKNDCELAAAERLYFHMRQSHPKLPMVLLQDSLFANTKNIARLKKYDFGYIIVAKEDKNKNLFKGIAARRSLLKDVVDFKTVTTIGDKVKKTMTRTYSYVNGIPLTGEQETDVNFIQFKETIEWEIKTGRKKGQIQKEEVSYAWITSINLDSSNIEKIVEAGRKLWGVENGVFNTLKNHGYRLEHNYGHGKKFLANNFAMLAMLAFLIDQVQEAHCDIFQEAIKRWKNSKSRIWKFLDVIISLQSFNSWLDLWVFLSKSGKRLGKSEDSC